MKEPVWKPKGGKGGHKSKSKGGANKSKQQKQAAAAAAAAVQAQQKEAAAAAAANKAEKVSFYLIDKYVFQKMFTMFVPNLS